MTNPFARQPTTIVVKQVKEPGILDYACGIGCGVPLMILLIAFVVNACTAPFLG